MLRSLYTAATGMEAQQLKMDTISNNLANASTTGYKRARPDFEDLLSETIHGSGSPNSLGGNAPAPLEVGLGVRPSSTSHSQAQGDPQLTQNPTDFLINGQGYFRVQRPNGEYAYTRSGNFTIDANSRLVTQHGEIVEPQITIPSDADHSSLLLDPQTGIMTVKVTGKTDPVQVGTLEISVFPNTNGLTSIGNNLLIETEASGPPMQEKVGEGAAGVIEQGQLETANVKAVEEMIDMITTQRAYEMNSKVIQTADQMLQKLTSLR